MRILMLSHAYPPSLSGVTLVVQKVSRAMARRGHTITVISGSDRKRPYTEEDQGVRLIRVRSCPNPFWREAPLPCLRAARLMRIVEAFQPDLVHTHENALLNWQLLRTGLTGKIPLIASCYFLPRFVTHYLPAPAAGKRIIQRILWTWTVRDLNRYDQVVFSTPSQRREYLEHGLTASSEAISNGVDPNRYHPPGPAGEAFRSLGHLPPGPRILFVGRLMKDKRIDLLIRAMRSVWAGRPAHLLIVGRGSERVRLEKLAQSLGVEHCVHWLGYVSEQDLPGLYRVSDLFAIASVCEVQSIPALQAAATGLPIVGVRAAALPELIQDGVNGFLTRPGDPSALADAILRILESPEQIQRFRQASLAIARDHAETQTFDRFEQLYRRVAGETRVTP